MNRGSKCATGFSKEVIAYRRRPGHSVLLRALTTGGGPTTALELLLSNRYRSSEAAFTDTPLPIDFNPSFRPFT